MSTHSVRESGDVMWFGVIIAVVSEAYVCRERPMVSLQMQLCRYSDDCIGGTCKLKQLDIMAFMNVDLVSGKSLW